MPKGRGRHAEGADCGRWNNGKLLDSMGYALVRVGRTHPLADPNGYVREHKLVVAAALGREALVGKQIHHRNGVKTDNRIENLELLTSSEHKALHAAEKSGRSPMGEAKVLDIRNRYAAGETMAAIARDYGILPGTVSKIVRGERWKHFGGPISTADNRRRSLTTGKFEAKAGHLLDGQEHREYPR